MKDRNRNEQTVYTRCRIVHIYLKEKIYCEFLYLFFYKKNIYVLDCKTYTIYTILYIYIIIDVKVLFKKK